MRLRNPFNPHSRQAFRALGVIEALERSGCRVLHASAHAGQPVIRVDRQPSLIDTWGFLPPPPGCVRVPVLCAAEKWGARIEWINPEHNQ